MVRTSDFDAVSTTIIRAANSQLARNDVPSAVKSR